MRNLPIGAEIRHDGVHFRVWAPKCHSVEVLIEENTYLLSSEEHGFFSGLVLQAKENTLYQFILNGKGIFPDPASRFQPKGPKGPSQAINPFSFQWSDANWKGIDKDKVILYEMHIGTFTEEGTWKSAIEKLSHLQELGITVIQMMPIAEFPGRFNWGYDGVNLFAPTHNYGIPNDLRLFVNEAHSLGIGVILDVVYNHFGPEDNYLSEFSDFYLKKEETEWGAVINFDGLESKWTRQFFIENAGYWVNEFHFDGLRLDACHSIVDKSHPHILLEINQTVRKKSHTPKTFTTAENEKQQTFFVFPQDEGLEFNAVYNEDFHHAAFVRLTKKKEAYLYDYTGKAQEFVSSLKYNFLYQGQWYDWQKNARGSPSMGICANHFINFLENHDQIANIGYSQRLIDLCHPKEYRAITTLFLLAPQIPMLFQGQEFGSSSPFYFFCEHNSKLAKEIYKGRLSFILQFSSLNHPDILAKIPDPGKELTFLKSKLNWEDLGKKTSTYQLHKDLISLRSKDAVFGDLSNTRIEGSTINEDILILRYFGISEERLLIINLGTDFSLSPLSDPLLASPDGLHWKMLFSSEKALYGGAGYYSNFDKGNWQLSGGTAVILYREPNND